MNPDLQFYIYTEYYIFKMKMKKIMHIHRINTHKAKK